MIKRSSDTGYVDLHLHTYYSDGFFSPEEIVQKAEEAGLRAIAITDHDCMDALPIAIRAAEKHGIEVIPAAEISAIISKTDIHILGYFLDTRNKKLIKNLSMLKNERIDRMNKMLSLLKKQGIDIHPDKLYKNISKGSLGRLHLAHALVLDGIVNTIKEAFEKYIGTGKSCYAEHARLNYKDAINMIHSAGGKAVLAHPGTMGNDEYLPDYVKAGLDGIEVYYTKHRPKIVEHYENVARKFDLVMTGGSDCHGTNEDKLLLGSLKIKYDVVEALRGSAENTAR